MTKRIKARKRWKQPGGRPRKLHAKREPSGRISKSWSAGETERDVTAVAIGARMRMYGVDETAAKQPNLTDVLERMVAGGQIDRRQCDALKAFREAHNAYQRAIGAKPDTGAQPPPETASSGTWEQFVAGALERWERIKTAVERLRRQQASYGHNCRPWAALSCFVVWNKHDHRLTGDLRIAANALLELESGRRAA